MADYKDKKKLDASIAGEFDILNVGFEEDVPFEISDNEESNWEGSYSFNIYNSKVKNDLIEKLSVGIEGYKLTFSLKPSEQGLSVGNHYFEIFNETLKRVEFKGSLEIIN